MFLNNCYRSHKKKLAHLACIGIESVHDIYKSMPMRNPYKCKTPSNLSFKCPWQRKRSQHFSIYYPEYKQTCYIYGHEMRFRKLQLTQNTLLARTANIARVTKIKKKCSCNKRKLKIVLERRNYDLNETATSKGIKIPDLP